MQHNKQHHGKVPLIRFHLNGHTLGLHPHTQNLEPPHQDWPFHAKKKRDFGGLCHGLLDFSWVLPFYTKRKGTFGGYVLDLFVFRFRRGKPRFLESNNLASFLPPQY